MAERLSERGGQNAVVVDDGQSTVAVCVECFAENLWISNEQDTGATIYKISNLIKPLFIAFKNNYQFCTECCTRKGIGGQEK